MVIDPDLLSPLSGAFEQAGFQVQIAGDVEALANAILPDAIVLREDIGSVAFRALLKMYQREPGLEAVPLVLITRDPRDGALAAGFRTGLVEVLSEPFDAIAHPQRVGQVLDTLSERWGSLSPPETLPRFLEHLRDTQRTGELVVMRDGRDVGRATFLRGAPQSAMAGDRSGAAALALLRAQPAPYRFLEVPPGTGSCPVSNQVPAALSRVLLVDDDSAVREALSAFLVQHGFMVTCAEDGERAWQIAQTTAIDLVVADLHMPALDGWGLICKLASDYRTREIPVALLTAHDSPRETLRSKSAGARLYLSKSPGLDGLPFELVWMLEPRREFLARVGLDGTLPVALEPIGPQWALQAIARVGASGRLQVADSRAEYVLYFRHGALVHARATIDHVERHGTRALSAFISSSGAEGVFTVGTDTPPRNVNGTLEEQFEHAHAVLNLCHSAAHELRVREGGAITVDRELYALYAKLCPDSSRDTVQSVCEHSLSLPEAIQRSGRAPSEVKRAFSELVRRQVIAVQPVPV